MFHPIQVLFAILSRQSLKWQHSLRLVSPCERICISIGIRGQSFQNYSNSRTFPSGTPIYFEIFIVGKNYLSFAELKAQKGGRIYVYGPNIRFWPGLST